MTWRETVVYMIGTATLVILLYAASHHGQVAGLITFDARGDHLTAPHGSI